MWGLQICSADCSYSLSLMSVSMFDYRVRMNVQHAVLQTANRCVTNTWGDMT